MSVCSIKNTNTDICNVDVLVLRKERNEMERNEIRKSTKGTRIGVLIINNNYVLLLLANEYIVCNTLLHTPAIKDNGELRVRMLETTENIYTICKEMIKPKLCFICV